MEVIRKNFREVLAELESAISSADFLAIDGEFTGLHGTGQDVKAFDTPAQYYSKIRYNCMDYLLIQFGLCIFKYDEENDKYTHRAYNFYIFPQAHGRSGPDRHFSCQSSSIEFLASQGFDFNKLFKEGIPYLRQPEEQKMRDSLEEKHKSDSSANGTNEEETSLIPIPDEHVTFIDDVCTQIENFLESTEPEELELDRCNAFLRKLIFQEVRQRFDSNTVCLESRLTDNRNRVLVVTRAGSEEERKQKEKEKMEKELQDLEDAVGFTAVIKKISKSGKLVIGHNMVLDICHVIHQCYFPLPESYSEFKELITCVFPKLLDTKYMSYSSVFRESINSNVLEHLHKSLSEEPFKMYTAEPEGEGLGYTSMSEKYHEAGYDAYITGLCFIAMANHIGSLEEPEMYPVRCSSPLLNPYINKLFLMRIQDSPYMNLVGPDPELPRSHVFFMTFPKEWTYSDFRQLFSPFGGVFISWISDTSAFVALNKRDQAPVVKKTLVNNDKYTLMTYTEYQKLEDKKPTCHCGAELFPKGRKRHATQAVPKVQVKRKLLDSTCVQIIAEEPEASSGEETPGTETENGASRGKAVTRNQKKAFEENDSWV